jgi:hypothetical protein
MHRFLRAGITALVLSAPAVSFSQQAIPPGLRDWQGWVLAGEEFRRCPFLATAISDQQPIARERFRCAWPDKLTLAVDARGGSFTQRWQVYAQAWVTLPGDIENWPRDVRLNGADAPVVERQGRPALRLAVGNHTLSGRFAWSVRPESLPLPASTAIVELSVDGQRVAQPERPDGAVWLGKRRAAEQPAAMEVQVYRLVNDDIPTYLTTRIRLNVAGDAREEMLARVLPDDFVPVSLVGALPARLERDGRLRVQVRPGSHVIELRARAATVANAFVRPDASNGKWAREEIWSFAADDPLRVAAAEGADGIDPVQANVPDDWRQYPAFRLDAASKLTITERSRGLANADDNRLSLERDLWLDFDHDGFTAVDQITGLMRRDWRLDMHAPFALASARQAEHQLLVTAGRDGAAGLELREPRLQLTTVARRENGSGSMPATGWDSRFDRVVGKLHLPAGHRLIAAVGADAAPQSWWERWGLWNVFGVMLIVVFVYWTAGVIPAAIGAVALVLMYQEAPAYLWLWGNLLAALAVARAAPEGRFRRIARGWRTASFVVMALALLPFLVLQFRYALYPQLAPGEVATSYTPEENENPYGLEALWSDGPGIVGLVAPSKEPAPAPPPPPPIEASIAQESLPSRMAVEDAASAPASSGLNVAQVVQRYAAGTVLQAGPGVPSWSFASYNYYWTGPVEAADRVRFVYLGPASLFVWRLLGIAGLLALFLCLAALSFDTKWKLPGRSRLASAGGAGAPGVTAVAVLVLALASATPVRAAGDVPAPGGDLLEQLKSRLIAPPACAPSCAGIQSAQVAVEGDRLSVSLRVSALADLAVALPHARDRWQLDEVSVDSRAAPAIGREGDATLWVPLTAGAHLVRLSGRLAAAESIQLVFPEKPRVIEARATGWVVSGVNEGRLVSGSLELVRERGAQRAGAVLEAGTEFPAFVRVQRTFNLDLDWTVDTRVVRIAPDRAAVSVEIPLVAGESVLTPGVEVHAGKTALVGLAPGELHVDWHSGLARAESLELALPAGVPRAEEWSFVVNPQWHVAFEGFPPVLPAEVDAPLWVFRFIPRPGESLKVAITRPRAVTGTTLAIDSVTQQVIVGRRSANTRLAFTARSTQGGRHVIGLPADARVTSVKLDDQPQQLRPEKGELPLSLMPGTHSIEIQWERKQAAGWRTHPPAVDLRSPASNIEFSISLPESRWPLFVWGPGIGPAVLYWGELLLFIGVAWLLGRWPGSPLRFTEWLLLGLGLSTQSWGVFMFTAAWLLVMRRRETWTPAAESPAWRFNVVQVLLAVFTVLVVSALVFSGIRNGLLAAPDMGIAFHDYYSSDYLRWFHDQSDGVIAAPTVISAPMWVYRALFFAWAGWMAFALVGWLKWAFTAWKSGGLWKGGSPRFPAKGVSP